MNLETLFSSFALVAVGEMGDKTQLLAFALAARFRSPGKVLAGIFVATVLNHLLAASLGQWGASLISPRTLSLAVAFLFIGFGVWALVPDTFDEEEKPARYGPFLTTAALFFVAEMGDKTQLATAVLAARFQSVVMVTMGTTLGMMVADTLAVFLGSRLAERVSMKWVRYAAAVLFFIFGAASAWNALTMTG
jgi:putative Ca2+/H+ antiporter (TMEM165/GDT1 family)